MHHVYKLYYQPPYTASVGYILPFSLVDPIYAGCIYIDTHYQPHIYTTKVGYILLVMYAQFMLDACMYIVY